MGSFRKLRAWQASHQLALEVYKATAGFPRREDYALSAQMRRAAASIPANLAEGCGRHGDAELGRFTRIALGSATELESHLLLARELEYLDPTVSESLEKQCLSVQNMLARLATRVTRTSRPIAHSP